MADVVGVAADFKIFPEQFFGGLQESLERNINGFNAASGGAIVLTPNRKTGYTEEEAFILDMGATAVVDRDPDDVADVDTTKITEDSEIRVKRFYRVGPFEQSISAFTMGNRSPQEFSLILGRMQGERVAERMIDDAIRAGVAASLKQEATIHGTPTANLDATAVVDGLSKFGDKAGALGLLVTHSKPDFDMVKDFTTAAGDIVAIGAAVIRGAAPPTLGRSRLIMDSTALKIDAVAAVDSVGVVSGLINKTGIGASFTVGQIVTLAGFAATENNISMRITAISADDLTVDATLTDEVAAAGQTCTGVATYLSLLLQPGGIRIDQSEEQVVKNQDVLGKANLTMIWQAQGAHNVGVKGYKYDSATPHPTTANLSDPTKWTKVATDVKSTAGVVLSTL